MNTQPYRVGLLLLGEYPMIAFSMAVEPLRMANRISCRRCYEWQVITLAGEAAIASNGLALNADAALSDDLDLDLLLVCGGSDIHEATSAETCVWLRRLALRGVTLGGLCAGTWPLLVAGLLDGRRWTIHWEHLERVREFDARQQPETELFVVDRDRLSATGGSGPMDLMLHLLSQHHGRELAAAAAEHLLCERIRGSDEPQRIPVELRLAHCPPSLRELVGLMEGNLDDPLPLGELARLAGVTQRQVERLFHRYFDSTPSRYYLSLRLQRARQLLRDTNMTVGEVAIHSGFVSAPHFSKAYRSRFGCRPASERWQSPE